MVLVMVLLLAKQIITLYHAVQKTLTKDQHALATARLFELGIDTSESDYRMALERIEAIFDAEPGTPEGNELENLASFVEEYEEKHFSF